MIILLAAALAGASAAEPVTARIEDVAANPAAFDGQWLRLRGQIDRCFNFGCAICPEDAATLRAVPGKCLSLVWAQIGGGPRERGPDRDAMNRYASVEIVARFDKACIDGSAICLDRAPVLFDTRVERVVRRRPSALGINATRAQDRMVDPPAAAAAPLVRLLMQMDRVTGAEPSPPRYRVFADPDDRAIARSAIVCRTRGADGDPATWPVDFSSAIFAPSTEDNFKCFVARRSDGAWLISPD